MEKVVLVYSGGLDSTTLLYWLKSLGYDIYPITFNYGQRHQAQEMNCVNLNLHDLNLVNRLKIVDLNLGNILVSALTGHGDFPDGHYEDKNMKQTVVPNRNMIMLSIAGGYAESIRAEKLAYGAHAGDHAIYRDCRPYFIKKMKEMLKISMDYPPDIITPFIKFKKDKIVKIGSELGVPFSKTYSCYKGGNLHCGTCGTCVERKEAFKLSEVQDPTIYQEMFK
jgi:7-cyano-7-deazaguanine synthase